MSHPAFPNSGREPFLITSPQTISYNCIAWAFGDDSKWYWPDSTNIYYWPEEVPREVTIDAFKALFATKGFQECDNDVLEMGVEKIVIYTKEGIVTHAAKQLQNGLWSSKLGQQNDVSHTINSMEDGGYGNATVFMSRPIVQQ
ncbi:DUF7689 domain-containing protein [Algoriphagus pacificus]|uniref:DUF7689 domain-containing protein n=1 Tax=Algoriphagus pacificus TaxID=2811234 RepID=A0ABS3CDD8_9BACT|nr:hypothetical protein [Algoriphagus pacificus]MBN7814210.1 hypothetical protein [Algoriphagus pacificus]